MSLVDDALLGLDPFSKEPQEPVKVGSKVELFSIDLCTGQTIPIDNVLKNGPVLLNFIRGTWCLFCRAHMRKVKRWMDATNANVTTIFVSDEDQETLKKWKEKSGFTWLFGSDPDQQVIKMFGLEFSVKECSRPAMFLIDQNRTIRIANYQKRNSKVYSALETELEKLSASEKAAS